MTKFILATIILASFSSLAQQKEIPDRPAPKNFKHVPDALPKAGDMILIVPASAKGEVAQDANEQLRALPFVKADRAGMKWKIVKGLKGGATISIESAKSSKQYLHNDGGMIQIDANDGKPAFNDEASFNVVRGFTDDDAFSLESVSHPGWFVHERGDSFFIDPNDGTPDFAMSASFYAQQLKPKDLDIHPPTPQPPTIPEYKVKLRNLGKGEIKGNVSCGIGDECTFTLKAGEPLLVTAIPGGGLWEFAGWSGGACAGTSEVCRIDGLKSDTEITATFVVVDTTELTITRPAAGMITESTSKLYCGDQCSGKMRFDIEATFAHRLDTPKKVFKNWTGICAQPDARLNHTGMGYEYCYVTAKKGQKVQVGAVVEDEKRESVKLTVKRKFPAGLPSSKFQFIASPYSWSMNDVVWEFPKGDKIWIAGVYIPEYPVSIRGDCNADLPSNTCSIVMDGDKSVLIQWTYK